MGPRLYFEGTGGEEALVVGDGYLRFALWDSGRVWRLSQGFCDSES